MAEIKRYDNEPGMVEDATGLWVLWSDVEPLLKSTAEAALLRPRPECTAEEALPELAAEGAALTDEQVLKLAGEFDSIVRTSRASDKRFDALRREMLCSLRAALKEVGRG